MEKSNTPTTIHCSQHPSQAIQRVNPDLFAQKHLYCFECMLESEDPKTLFLNLPTLPIYFATTDLSFTNSNPTPGAEIPSEYVNILSHRGEQLEKLSKHITSEKEQVKGFFDEITKALLETLDIMKMEYLLVLDKQLENMHEHYIFFEKELMKAYYEPKHIELRFPYVDDLRKRISLTSDSLHLEELIRDIKADIHQRGLNIQYQGDEKRTWYFNDLVKNLKKAESMHPMFEGKDSNVHIIRDSIKKHVQQLVETVFVLKNPIANPHEIPSISDSPSQIIGPKDFLTIKEWLPHNHNCTFTPKLIYRGTRDGMTPEAFHEKCDNKGSTITLIKCQFSKSGHDSVIGGFLDQNWHQDRNGSYIGSHEAFVFSLTAKLKCPITRHHNAAYAYSDYGPTFGGHDICITRDMNKCFSRPYSYANSLTLSQATNSNERQACNFFVTKEIEVYTLH